MVAIVTGNSLGLLGSSLGSLGGAGSLGSSNQGNASEKIFVNAANGNLIVQRQDELLRSLGLDAGLVRTYNSLGQLNDDNADNWRLGLSRKVFGLTGTVNTVGSTITRTDEDGGQVVYTYDAASGKYVSHVGAGALNTLTYDAVSDNWTWRDGNSQATERYNSHTAGGQLHTVTDRNGNTLTLSYTGDLVTRIETSSGERIDIVYDSTAGKTANILEIKTQTKVSGTDSTYQTSTHVRYAYDATNRLQSVSVDITPDDNSIADGNTYVTSYSYDGTSNRIASIVQTDGSEVRFTYDGNGRVLTVSDVRSVTDIRVTTLTYGSNQTTVTDALGQVTTLSYDAEGQLTRLSTQAQGETVYSYDARGNVTQVTDARGQTVVYGYDANNNRIYQRDAAGNVVEREYSSNNELVKETLYRVTDPDGAGVQLPNQPLITRYTYDAQGNLRFRVSAEGRVTELRYDAYGQETSSIVYTAGLYTGSASDLLALAAWASTQNLAQTQRIDTAYDFRGQVSSVTSYSRIDATGNGVRDGSQSETHYVYDQSGLLLQTINPRGVATTGASSDYITSYTYDGMGRVLATVRTDQYGSSLTLSSHIYNDAQRQSTTFFANGGFTTTTYDKAGLAISVIQIDGNGTPQQVGRTDYVYDQLGRPVAQRITTAAGSVLSSYVIYDSANRKVADIDATGAVREYVYNNNGQVIRSIAYSQRVTASVLAQDPSTLTLADVRSASAENRITQQVYDATGRLAKTIDAEGAVVQYQYDGTSRLIQTTAYANRLTVTQLAALAALTGEIAATDSNTNPVVDANNDRTTRQFYSDDGLLLGALDAEGYLSESSYDAAGQLTQTVRYATATAVALRATGDLASLRPATDAKDIATHLFYNARGQATGSIDAEGYLTEVRYDEAGNVSQTTRYATRITVTIVAGATVESLRPTTSASDRTTLNQYNADQRLIRQEKQPTGLITVYTYDLGGNITSVTQMPGTVAQRQQLVRYDVLGQVIAELSAENAARITSGMTQTQIDGVWNNYATRHTYDQAGLRTSSTDALGHQTLYYYDAQGRLSTTINAAGEVAHSVYNAFGEAVENWHYKGTLTSTQLATLHGGTEDAELETLLTGITAVGIVKTKANMSLRGQIQAAFDALGNDTYRSYNAFGEVTQESRLESSSGSRINRDFVSYDRRGLLTYSYQYKTGSSDIAASSQQYDAFGRVISSIAPNGVGSSAQYDRLGRTVSTYVGATGTYFAYDAFGRTLVSGNTDGEMQTVYDDVLHKVTTTTREKIVTSSVRNVFGEVINITDGRGNTTSYQYNLDGQLSSITDPAGTTTTSYDATGQQLSTTDRNGVITQYSYDAVGRVLSRTVDPTGLNLTTSTRYDALGRAVWQQNANGVWTRTDYDDRGQVTLIEVDPTGLALKTAYTYDAVGNTLTVTEGAGTAAAKTTQYSYDAQGKRTSETVDPTGLAITTTYRYDHAGNLIQKTDANGNSTHYGYDGYGRLTVTVDAVGAVTRTVYDDQNRITAVHRYASVVSTATLGNVSNASTGVRAESELLNLLPANASYTSTHYSYDKDGRQTYTVDAIGVVRKNSYDANGNVVAKITYATPIALTAATSTATIEAALVVNAALDQTTSYVFDAANRLTYSIDAKKYVNAYVYDANGNVTQSTRYVNSLNGAITNNGSISIIASGTTTGAYIVSSPTQDRTVRQVYDSANRLIIRIDLNSETSGYVTQYAYDANDNLKTTTNFATQITLPSLYSAADVQTKINLIKNQSIDQTQSQTFDKAGRLVETTNAEGYTSRRLYDATGRTTDVIQAYGTEQARTTHFTYNTAGRLSDETQAYGTSFAVTTHYEYDATGNQVRITEAYGTTLARFTQQRFDSINRKIETINALGKSTKTEYNAFGDITKVIDPNGATGYFYNDALGRVILLVNPDHGITSHTYDAFGNQTEIIHYATRVTGTLDTHALPAVTPSINDQRQVTSYDQLGRKTEIKTWWGVNATNFYIESFNYDHAGNVLTSTARNGATTTYAYDKLSRKINETLPVQTRNASGTPISVVNTFAYDPFNNLILRTEAAGAPEQRITSYAYDKLNRQIRETGQSFMAFDSASSTDRLVTPTKSKNYDIYGNVRNETDANGSINHYYYDPLDRRIGSIGADGSYTRFTYDAIGNLNSQTTYTNGIAISGSASISSNVPKILTTAPATGTNTVYVLAKPEMDRTIYFSYDAIGRKISTEIKDITVGSYNTEIDVPQYQIFTRSIVSSTTYDANGNVIKLVDGNANTTRTYYNNVGETVAQIDALGYLTTWTRDAHGNIIQEVRYAKKIDGALLAVSDSTTPAQIDAIKSVLTDVANDRITEITYDKLNRISTESILNVVTGKVNPTTGVLTKSVAIATTWYSYDGLNNVTQKRDATNAVTDWIFDGIGREVSEIRPQFADYTGTLVRSRIDTEYNGLNLVTREITRGTNDNVETDDHIVTSIYGIGGLLNAQIDATGARTEYQYDANGNITKKTLKNRRTADQVQNNLAGIDDVTTYNYDSKNRQIKNLDQGTGLITESRYNVFGELTGKRSYVGTAPIASNPQSAASGWQEYVEYDQAGRAWKSNAGDGITKVYLYDTNGNLTLKVTTTFDSSYLSLNQILARSNSKNPAERLQFTVNIFDRKNQLIDTLDPSLSSSNDMLVIRNNSSDQYIPATENIGIEITPTETVAVGGSISEVRNASAFAAIRNDGSVVSWGPALGGGDMSAVASQLNGTIKAIKVFSSWNAFAALREDGSVVTWGLSTDGGDSSGVAALLNGTIKVTHIFSSNGAFAALRADGSVVTWGNTNAGGNSNTVSSSLNGAIKVVRIYSTDSAFAALREDGSVVTWGQAANGGDSSNVANQINGGIKVTAIYASTNAFAALRADGSVVTWGNSTAGGSSSTVANQINGNIKVTQITSTANAFSALREDGSVVSWGPYNFGGDNSAMANQINGSIKVVKIYASRTAFAALREDGSVVAWGHEIGGGEIDDAFDHVIGSGLKVKEIYSSRDAFAAIMEDGSVITWGETDEGNYGGDSSAVSTQINGTIPVVKIYSTGFSFAALRADGSVVSWGSTRRGDSSLLTGADSSSVASQLNGVTKVIDIFSTDYGYAALREDGSVVTWGGRQAFPGQPVIGPNGISSGVTTISKPHSATNTAIIIPKATVHFTEPPETAHIEVTYRLAKDSLDVYKTVLIPASTTGKFDWLINLSELSGSYYDAIVKAYDATNTLLNTTNITLSLGIKNEIISQHTVYDKRSNEIQVQSTLLPTSNELRNSGQVRNMSVFAAIRNDGSVVTIGNGNGADMSSVAAQLNGTIKAVQTFSSLYAFAALREDGSVVTWGLPTEGGNSSSVAALLNGTIKVKQIFSSNGAFAALRADGSVVTWGNSNAGGNSNAVSNSLNGAIKVIQVFSTDGAFAALREDGSVVTWGQTANGGDSASILNQINGNIKVTAIYSNTNAFAALRADGSVVTWGNSASGGNSAAVSTQINGNIKVTQIISTEKAFSALRADGSVVSWGASTHGGDNSAMADQINGSVKVAKIYASAYAFAALREDGSVIAWGPEIGGGEFTYAPYPLNGMLKIKQIYSSRDAFAALMEDGSVITWGESYEENFGGDSSEVLSQIDGSIPVLQIYSTGYSFAALRADGSVVTWGEASREVGDYEATTGGDSSEVASLLNGTKRVINIFATSAGYAALREDGMVVTWWGSERWSDTIWGNSPASATSGISYVANSVNQLNTTSATIGIKAPQEAEYLTISYAADGNTDQHTTSKIYPTAPGTFNWDASGLVAIKSNTYAYNIVINAFNSENQLIKQVNASITLGAFASVKSVLTAAIPQTLDIEAPQKNSVLSFIGYRAKNSSGAYIPLQPTNAYINNLDVLKYRINIPVADLQGGEYEYQYIFSNAENLSTQVGTGLFDIKADTTPSPQKPDWLIISTSDTDKIISRKKNYNAFGDVIQSIDGRGNTTDYTYNTQGKMILKRDPLVDITLANGYQIKATSGSAVRPSTEYTYDLTGRMLAVKDANGNLNIQDWLDGTEKINFERHADGGIKTSGYDIFGNIRTTFDELATSRTLSDTDKIHRTDYSYDANNRLIRVDRPQRTDGSLGDAIVGLGATRAFDQYDYDIAGNRISHTNALNTTEKTFFDSLGRIIKQQSFAGFTTKYIYEYQLEDTAITGLINRKEKISGWKTTTVGQDDSTLVDFHDVFKRIIYHRDMSDRSTLYDYNYAGWLTRSGYAFYTYYQYLNNGFISSLSGGNYIHTEYGYDVDGNKVKENYFNLENNQNYSQKTTISYDSQNRITHIVDANASITYEYDGVGNKRRINSIYKDAVTGANFTQDFWYSYDNVNRFTVTMGTLSTGANGNRGTSENDNSVSIVTGTTGVAIAYNAIGQRTLVANGIDGSIEKYSYTNDGYLEETRIKLGTQTSFVLRAQQINDALGRVSKTNQYTQGDNTGNGSALSYTRTTTYDADNRILNETGTDGTTTYNYFLNYMAARRNETASSTGAGSLKSITNINNGTTLTTTYTYGYWDEAKVLSIKIQPNNGAAPGWAAGYSDIQYSYSGKLLGAIDHVGNRTFSYITNGQGQILNRTEKAGNAVTRIQNYFYVDGKRVGDTGNNGPSRTDYALALANQKIDKKNYANWQAISSADFDQNYEPIGPSSSGGTAAKYVVHAGDTLQSIASATWGDSSLWYVIANANGLTSSQDLVAGMGLTIPNKVTNIHNNSGTFRPYNIGEAMGDVNPTLPEVPPPPPPPPPPQKGGGCGGIGSIIVMVVAIVATVLTAGALAPIAGQSIWFAGAAALTSNIGVAVVAGAIGSVASQGVAMAVGLQDKFSWSGVAMGAIGAGLGAALGPTSQIGSYLGGNSAQGVILRSAAGNIASQGIAVATGLQQKFDWRGVASAAVGAGVSSAIGGGAFGRLAGGISASAIVSGGRLNAQSMAGAIGSFIGESVVSQLNTGTQVLGKTFAEDVAARKAQNYWNAEPSNQSGYQLQSNSFSAPPSSNLDFTDALINAFENRSGVTYKGPLDGLQLAANNISDPSLSMYSGGYAPFAKVYDEITGTLMTADENGKFASSKSNTQNHGDVLRLGPSQSEYAELDAIAEKYAAADRASQFAVPSLGNSSYWNTTDEIRALTPWEGVLTFNSVGQAASGFGNAALSFIPNTLELGKQAGLAVTDTIDGAVNWAGNAITGSNLPYQPNGAVYQSIQRNGILTTGLSAIGSTVKGLISPIDAIYKRDARAIGQAAFDVASSLVVPSAIRSQTSSAALTYDISKWGQYGLPSDGVFARTLTSEQYRAYMSGREFNFAGKSWNEGGYPRGMGFIGAAEDIRGLTTASAYRDGLKLDYEPKYVLEFQLRNPSGLQNAIRAPYAEFVPGGKTGAGLREWNFPGISSSDITNATVRKLK